MQYATISYPDYPLCSMLLYLTLTILNAVCYYRISYPDYPLCSMLWSRPVLAGGSMIGRSRSSSRWPEWWRGSSQGWSRGRASSHRHGSLPAAHIQYISGSYRCSTTVVRQDINEFDEKPRKAEVHLLLNRVLYVPNLSAQEYFFRQRVNTVVTLPACLCLQ